MIELIAGSVCKMPTVGKVTRDILLRSYNYCCNRLNGCCSYLMQEEDESGTEYKCAYYGNSRCKDGMLDDAIEFLKEQEPKPVELHTNAYGTRFYFCPKCKRELFHTRNLNFCERCGQAVKWDG